MWLKFPVVPCPKYGREDIGLGSALFSFLGRSSRTASPASSLGGVRLASAGVLVDGGAYIPTTRETV